MIGAPSRLSCVIIHNTTSHQIELAITIDAYTAWHTPTTVILSSRQYKLQLPALCQKYKVKICLIFSEPWKKSVCHTLFNS